jgi:beta-lactamase class A
VRPGRWSILMVALLLAHLPTPAQPQAPASGLPSLLEAELQRFPARTGLWVHHLGNGDQISIRGDDAFNSQSVIKLMILVKAFQMADAGTLELDRRVELGVDHLRHGAGFLQYHDPGLEPTLRDLLLHMVVTSDNIATDVMLAEVGGKEALNRWIVESGFADTRKVNQGWEYRRKLLALLDPRFATATAQETTALQYGLAGSPLLDRLRHLFTGDRGDWLAVVQDPANRARYAERRDLLMVQDESYWLGSMTPRETGLLLEAIERCTLTSRESCDTMRLFLRQQQAGARRLRQFLTVPIGHKTGDSAVISNDVGIIYARSGPIVVSFFVNGIQGSLAEAETRMGRIAQLIVGYYDGVPGGG